MLLAGGQVFAAELPDVETELTPEQLIRRKNAVEAANAYEWALVDGNKKAMDLQTALNEATSTNAELMAEVGRLQSEIADLKSQMTAAIAERDLALASIKEAEARADVAEASAHAWATWFKQSPFANPPPP